MIKPIAAVMIFAIVAGGYALSTQSNDQEMTTAVPASTRPVAEKGAALVSIAMPDTLGQTAKIGAAAFNAKCAACHGENGVGVNGAGPPLIHKIYEPSHHGDGAFFLAVQNGVRAHHWKFGDMPPQDGLTRADVGAIVAFVREVQAANGIQ